MNHLTLDELKEQLNWYSSSVSSAVRVTSFGVIAAIWAVFTADGISLQASGLFGLPIYILVKLAFIFAGGALLADILQYVSAYWMTSIGYDRCEGLSAENKIIKFCYDVENLGKFGLFLYRFSFVLFPCKLMLAILSAMVFLFLAFGINISNERINA